MCQLVKMQLIKTQFSGYSVQFSPFHENLIAVATSQYYGIAGNGRVVVYDLMRGGLCEFVTRDGCFDVCWSEKNDSILAAATGDGSLHVFDTSGPVRPVLSLTGHSAEAYSVDWNAFNRDMLCSASWDKSVRIWDAQVGKCVGKFTHSQIAYEARWSVKNGAVLASVGGCGNLLIHDHHVRSTVCTVKASYGEVLCLDWNKYNENLIVTGSVDRSVRVWDLRKPSVPVFAAENGHELAVRRVKFSPHSEDLIASCSYDMTVKLRSVSTGIGKVFNQHSEFVIGLAWSNLRPNLLASTGWDKTVAVWNPVDVAQKPTVRLAAA